MSRFSVTTKEPEQTISVFEANSVFADLEANTDGTTGRIDASNMRDGAFTSKHIAIDSVHTKLNTEVFGATTGAGSVLTSGVAPATTSWVNLFGDILLTAQTLAREGDVLRYHINILVGDTTDSGGNIYKAQQVYFYRIKMLYRETGSGTLKSIQIQEPYGYGLCQRSGNDASTTGSAGDAVAAWSRNPMTGLWICRGQVDWELVGIRIQFRWAENDDTVANTVAAMQLTGSVVLERM